MDRGSDLSRGDLSSRTPLALMLVSVVVTGPIGCRDHLGHYIGKTSGPDPSRTRVRNYHVIPTSTLHTVDKHCVLIGLASYVDSIERLPPMPENLKTIYLTLQRLLLFRIPRLPSHNQQPLPRPDLIHMSLCYILSIPVLP